MSNEAAAEPAGLKVLVIDDSNTIRRSAEIFLKQGGYEVLLAEDGFDALSKVNDHAPDLIFCDILMPRLDGYQTCAIIKRNARFASVPIIMLTAKAEEIDRIVGRTEFKVNSLHRQAIDRLGDGLVVEATAPDGTIEAVSVEAAKGFTLGVQWHPEYWAESDAPSASIFTAFGDACRAYRKSRATAR